MISVCMITHWLYREKKRDVYWSMNYLLSEIHMLMCYTDIHCVLLPSFTFYPIFFAIKILALTLIYIYIYIYTHTYTYKYSPATVLLNKLSIHILSNIHDCNVKWQESFKIRLNIRWKVFRLKPCVISSYFSLMHIYHKVNLGNHVLRIVLNILLFTLWTLKIASDREPVCPRLRSKKMETLWSHISLNFSNFLFWYTCRHVSHRGYNDSY